MTAWFLLALIFFIIAGVFGWKRDDWVTIFLCAGLALLAIALSVGGTKIIG